MNRDTLLGKIKDTIDKEPEKEFVAGKTYVAAHGAVIDGNDVQAICDVALSRWFTEGAKTEQFGRDMRHYFKDKIRTVIMTNSGSSANLLATTAITDKVFGSRAAKPGDEIITVSAGFPTTLNPILQNNLVPVFVDVNLETFCPDPEIIEQAIIQGKTKGIILAHPLGNPFDAEAIRDICNEFGIWMIEDTADALGSELNGKLCGSFGDLSTLSFYPAHHITSGEGGAVLTSSPMVKKIVESYRDWGRACNCPTGCDNTCGKRFGWQLGKLPFGYDHKYTYSRIGYNLKSTDLAAALLVSQLKKLPQFIESRRSNWSYFRENMDKFSKFFRFMKPIQGANPSWFGFAITVKETAPFTRNDITSYLEEHKIGTRVFFGGNLLRQPTYSQISHKIFQEPINADILGRDTFWIGVHPNIHEQEREYVVKTIEDFINENRK